MGKKYHHNRDRIAELWDEGYGVAEIADKLKKSTIYVRTCLFQSGIEMDPKPEPNEFKNAWNRARWKLTGLPKDAKEQDYVVWFENEWKKAVKMVLYPRLK